MNLMLTIGAMSFRSTRVELFESLIDKMDNTAASSVEKLDQIFGQWAKRDRQRNDSRAPAMAYIHRQLEQGKSLSEAIRRFVPVEEVLIIQSGEIRGNLTQSLELVVRNIKATKSMRSSVLAAMAQPAIGMGSLLVMGVVLGLVMWPDLIRAMPLKYWPSWSHLCIEFQMWLGKQWMWLSLLTVVVAGYYYTLPRWVGSSRTWFDSIPPWSIYRGQQASSLLSVMAALVESGRTVRESLVLMKDNASPYMAWQLSRIIRKLDAAGEEGIKSLRTGFFSRQIMDRIEDAASNRTFGATLRYVGKNSLKLIVSAVQKQATIASTIFLLIVGAGFIYLTAVLVIGMQEATDALTSSAGLRK